MNQEELERLAQEFEAQQKTTEQSTESVESPPIVVKTEEHKVADNSQSSTSVGFGAVVGGVQQDILEKAKKKIASDKIVDKHSESLKNIADKALEVEAEQASLQVQQQEADNKIRKQEIRNQLIVLNAEAKRLEKEQKQLNKEQKADHKARNKQAKWELYGDKLKKMKYSYVPNIVVLSILLFFDGVRGFFDGLGTVSTAMVKAARWIFIIGIILIVLFAIPVTNHWITNLLSGGH